MLHELRLSGVGPVPHLVAAFGERLNLLTGDNGLGKTFLLDVAFWSLTGEWAGEQALPAPGHQPAPSIQARLSGAKGKSLLTKGTLFDYTTQTWIRKPIRPTRPSIVIYAQNDGGFAVWDPARNPGPPDTANGNGSDTPPLYRFTPETLRDGMSVHGHPVCEGLVRDWVRWYDQRDRGQTLTPFHLLTDVVAALAHPQEPMRVGVPRRLYLHDSREFPTLDLPHGNVPYPHLSAGMRRVVALAYLLVWAWQEHLQTVHLQGDAPADTIVFLIDEIEAHLHPKWQRSILPALVTVATRLRRDMRVQLFVATHSPLVLASVETLFEDEKDRLFWLDVQDKHVQFRPYPWAKQGDVVGWLTSELFDLKQARSREAEAAILAAEAFMRDDTQALPPGLQTKSDIDRALREALPGLDPFWPRWIVQSQP